MNPKSTAAAPASVARPFPHWSLERRHPTSTAGRTSGRKCGTANPAQPIILPDRALDQRLDAEAVALVTRQHAVEEETRLVAGHPGP